MSDERDLIERAKQIAENWTGSSMSQDEMVQEFRLYGPVKRAQTLDDLDAEYAAADTSDLRKHFEISRLRKKMRETHHALRQAKR